MFNEPGLAIGTTVVVSIMYLRGCGSSGGGLGMDVV